MKKTLITLILILISFFSFSQKDHQIVKINVNDIQNKLKSVPVELSIVSSKQQAVAAGISINLPLPSGSEGKYTVVEAPVMSPELAKKFPEIKTYRVFGNNEVTGLITVAPSGVYGLIFETEGNVIIAPKDILQNEHEVFFQEESPKNFDCKVFEPETKNLDKKLKIDATQSYSNGTILRTYRMAIVTTGEFYTANGATESSAQAAVVSMVNSLRAVYEKEVSISFTLVATKLYSDAATDPFNRGENSQDAAFAFGSLISTEPANFALSKYDIGHVLNGGLGGGVATLGSACQNLNVFAITSPKKAAAWSNSTPTSFNTFIHEVGHQFGAIHTFNSILGGCSGNIAYAYGDAYEPGSGSTYMSYWGLCEPDNISGIVNNTYFHTSSIQSIINYSTISGTCSINTPTGNTPPIVVANPNSKTLIIPKGTPFVLEGSGTDANGHTILYNWEQYNRGTTRGGADDAQNSTDSPIFRSVPPSASGNNRMFPDLSTILDGSLPNNDEALPQVARTITMRLTGRDNNGGIHCASVNITVTNSPPFKISSFNKNSVWQNTGNGTDKVLLTWDVSSTNQAPINCSDVKITFSTDGGLTFPITILASTPNDGSELINVPSSLTTTGRIKVEAIGNIFFDINDRNITISNTCIKETSRIDPETEILATVGSDTLKMNGTAYFVLLFPASVQITAAYPSMNLIVINTTNSTCTSFRERPKYKKYEFRVTATGNYTFTFSGSTIARPVMNLYQNTFNSDEPCTNWLMSSGNYTNGIVTTGSTMTYNLIANVTYILVVSGYNNNDTGTCSVTCTNSVSGEVRYSEPKTSFKYLVVNSNNIITGFLDNTNLLAYPSGQYKLYVFSYVDNLILSNYTNTNFTTFQNLIYNNTLCGSLSDNYRQVIIYQPILYVRQGGTGAGTSWADASGDLQAMIETNLVQQVWVAAGTFKPTTGTDRTKSFNMKAGVKIYGGFPATGNPAFTDRNWNLNKTYLSGDLLGDDIVTGAGNTLTITNNSENSYSVISNNDNGLTTTNSLIDGFIITGGNTNATIANTIGGGMYNFNSSPRVVNVVFTGNYALFGGAIFNKISFPTLQNIVFSKNLANSGGGLCEAFGSRSNIVNATFFGNGTIVGGVGGGMYVTDISASVLHNSIFWGNSASIVGSDIAIAPGGTVTIDYSLLQSQSTQYAAGYTLGTGMVYGVNPLFVDVANANLALQAQSCAINAGNNAEVSGGITTDLMGNARFYNSGIVDMGAYEFQGQKQTYILPSLTTNNALKFDGVDDHVSITTSDFINCGSSALNFSDAITIEYWFKGTNPQSAVRFQNGQNYIVAGWGSGTFKHILSNDGGVNGIAVGSAATDGNWHHVAMTWQRNTANGFKSYLDGVLVEQRQSSNTALPSFSSGMFLGAFDGTSEFLNGALDEVRVWNVARSQAEIQANMCGLNLPQNGLILNYKFNHGTINSGNVANNQLLNSAAANTFLGTLNNFALTSSNSNWVETNTACTVNFPVVSFSGFTRNSFCTGSSFNLTFTTTGSFNAGNTFQAIISDNNGDFSSGQIIGTSSTVGNIPCTIPANLVFGSNYRIKVASTFPSIGDNTNLSNLTVHPKDRTLASPTNNNTSGTSVFKASETITATNTNTSTANVSYVAGKSILLSPGFSVSNSGAVFKAEIRACD